MSLATCSYRCPATLTGLSREPILPGRKKWFIMIPKTIGGLWKMRPTLPVNSRESARMPFPPAWLERVESFLTLRTTVRNLKVYPLDGAGERLAALDNNGVQRIKGGVKVHLHAEGQPKSPWFEFAVGKAG